MPRKVKSKIKKTRGRGVAKDVVLVWENGKLFGATKGGKWFGGELKFKKK